jgi:hypothetical protein
LWSAEEFMGREGHTLMLGGVFDRVADDPESSPEMAAWCRRVLYLCDDLPMRRRLQEQYLTTAELEAADLFRDEL